MYVVKSLNCCSRCSVWRPTCQMLRLLLAFSCHQSGHILIFYIDSYFWYIFYLGWFKIGSIAIRASEHVPFPLCPLSGIFIMHSGHLWIYLGGPGSVCATHPLTLAKSVFGLEKCWIEIDCTRWNKCWICILHKAELFWCRSKHCQCMKCYNH